MRSFLRAALRENIAYKSVALLIAIALWVTIMSRRDFVFSRTMEVEVRTAAGVQVGAQTADRVRLRLSGPKSVLRRWAESSAQQVLVVDLTDREAGTVEADVPLHRLVLPAGVRVLSVRPNVIRVELVKGAE